MLASKTNWVFFFVCIVELTACGGALASNTVVDSNPSGSGAGSGTGTTTSNSKFQEVLKIFQNNCIECHNGDVAMGLTNYSQISFFASDCDNRINKSVGDSRLMPNRNVKLSDTEIATFESWIAGGKLNN